MPHPWALVDSSFPTFTGDESPREQVQQIVEYMMLLTEALKYQLENLDANNWNTSALKTFQSDTTQDVEAQGQMLASNMILLANELTMLSNRISAVESLTGRVTQAETDIAYLERQQNQTDSDLDDLQEQVSAMQVEIDGQDLEIDRIRQMIDADENGNPTIGGTGKNVYLVGNVYINGKLYE